MGNLLQDNEKENKTKKEQKERLNTEEIPSDTQKQMNEKEEEFQQDEGPENFNDQDSEESKVHQEIIVGPKYRNNQIDLIDKRNQNQDEQIESQQQQQLQQQEINIVQEREGNYPRYKGGFRYIENGELFQVNENGKIYKVIQEPQNYDENINYGPEQDIFINQDNLLYQNNQVNQVLAPKIARPIFQDYQDPQQYQTYQQNQIYQQIQDNMQSYLEYLPLNQYQSFQKYPQSNNFGNQIYDTQYINNTTYNDNNYSYYYNTYNTDWNTINNEELKQKKYPKDKILTWEEKSKLPLKLKRINKNSEPKDSISKIHIISNKGHILPNLNHFNKSKNKNIFINTIANKGIGNRKYCQFNIYKSNNDYYKNGDNIRNQILRTCNKNIDNLKSRNKLHLMEELPLTEEIPRVNQDPIILKDGNMFSGEYKFIGEKKIIKEKDEPMNKTVDPNRELIMKGINRRKKTRNEKKITFEVVNKYYSMAEIDKNNITQLEESDYSKKKNDFYSTLKYSKDYSISHNNTNINTNNNTTKNSYSINENKNKNQINNINNIKNNKNMKNKKQEIMNLKKKIVTTKAPSNAPLGKTPQNNKINFFNNTIKTLNKKSRIIRFDFQKTFENKINMKSSGKNQSLNSFYFFNKNSIAYMPMDNYSKCLLEQINKIRSDPQSFISIIQKAKSNITKDRFGRLIFNGKIKIALAHGESAFSEAINYLKKKGPMEPLKYLSHLTILPPQNEKEIKDKGDLNKKVGEMIKSGVPIKSYWRDIIKDPEISFLLMIVDDNGIKSGMRRKDILNPRMKYIGISSVEIKKNFVCYITLG